MRKLDELMSEFEKGEVDRRTFIKRAIAMGLTLSSVTAFLSSSGRMVRDAFGQIPPAGKPANITVGYFPSWVGGWSGAIIKHKELWKKYLPAGSKVSWDIQVVGPPIVANLMANKSQIGYMGDTPAIVATTKRDIADLRIVEVNMFSDTGEICSDLLVRSDAPQFRSIEEVVKWLEGKKIGVSGKGSCGDRFVSGLVKKANLNAEIQYLDPTIIKTALQAKKIDAAQSFEPHVSQIMNHGIGRLVSTGSRWASQDANFILMRKDFIDTFPDAAKGWIKADIEALQFILKNPGEAIKLIAQDLPGYTIKDLWMALYGRYPENTGAKDTRVTAQVTFNERVLKFIEESFQFLRSKGAISIDKMPSGAIYVDLVDEVVKEMKVKTPLGSIKTLPPGEFKG
jgi:NitT/TauT family transport system substrate-binding protein